MDADELPPSVTLDPRGTIAAYWADRVLQHTRDRYAGIPISKFPEDLRTYEHLMWRSRSNVVIELGSQHGGSALWFRDRLRALAAYGRISEPRVICVDVDIELARDSIAAADPKLGALTLLAGDVRDPELPDLVARHVTPGARCLVVEDSAHLHETTLAALRGFARFVPPHGFFVVEDGYLDLPELRFEEAWPRGVLHALDEWIRSPAGAGFEIRRDLELYGMTSHPYGYVERVCGDD